MAGLPARDRGRQLADRRDGQDRRPLLLLQGDPAGAWPASTVDADRRPRGGPDQPRARRFRGRGDGPHRPPGRARRPRVPPHRPEPEDRRPGDQRVCARRARSRGHDADRPPDDQRGPEAGAEDACPAPAREAHHRSGAGRLRHPPRGRSHISTIRATTTRGTRRRRSRARESRSRRWRATPTGCGTTGSETSTRTCSRTVRCAGRSRARWCSSPARRAASEGSWR